MSSFRLAALFFLILTSATIAAPDVPPAPVPRLGTAPVSAAWTIDHQYKSPNPHLNPPNPSMAGAYAQLRNQFARPQTIQVVKAGANRKEVLRFDNDTQVIHWIVGDLMVLENPQRKTYSVWDSKVPDNPDFMGDFPSLKWIDQADYKGHQPFQNVDCCVYTSKTTPLGEQTAYISVASGLPVAVVQGGVVQVYTFNSAGGSLEIPVEITTRLKAYQESIGRPAQ